MAKKKSPQGVVYRGGGFVSGIPARDMTSDEWGALPEALRETALTAGLYEIVEPPAEPTDAGTEEDTDGQ